MIGVFPLAKMMAATEENENKLFEDYMHDRKRRDLETLVIVRKIVLHRKYYLERLLEKEGGNVNYNSIEIDDGFIRDISYISVKERVNRYEKMLDVIKETENYLKQVQKHRGVVLKDDIKNIIKELETRGRIKILTVADMKEVEKQDNAREMQMQKRINSLLAKSNKTKTRKESRTPVKKHPGRNTMNEINRQVFNNASARQETRNQLMKFSNRNIIPITNLEAKSQNTMLKESKSLGHETSNMPPEQQITHTVSSYSEVREPPVQWNTGSARTAEEEARKWLRLQVSLEKARRSTARVVTIPHGKNSAVKSNQAVQNTANLDVQLTGSVYTGGTNSQQQTTPAQTARSQQMPVNKGEAKTQQKTTAQITLNQQTPANKGNANSQQLSTPVQAAPRQQITIQSNKSGANTQQWAEIERTVSKGWVNKRWAATENKDWTSTQKPTPANKGEANTQQHTFAQTALGQTTPPNMGGTKTLQQTAPAQTSPGQQITSQSNKGGARYTTAQIAAGQQTLANKGRPGQISPRWIKTAPASKGGANTQQQTALAQTIPGWRKTAPASKGGANTQQQTAPAQTTAVSQKITANKGRVNKNQWAARVATENKGGENTQQITANKGGGNSQECAARVGIVNKGGENTQQQTALSQIASNWIKTASASKGLANIQPQTVPVETAKIQRITAIKGGVNSQECAARVGIVNKGGENTQQQTALGQTASSWKETALPSKGGANTQQQTATAQTTAVSQKVTANKGAVDTQQWSASVKTVNRVGVKTQQWISGTQISPRQQTPGLSNKENANTQQVAATVRTVNKGGATTQLAAPAQPASGRQTPPSKDGAKTQQRASAQIAIAQQIPGNKGGGNTQQRTVPATIPKNKSAYQNVDKEAVVQVKGQPSEPRSGNYIFAERTRTPLLSVLKSPDSKNNVQQKSLKAQEGVRASSAPPVKAAVKGRIVTISQGQGDTPQNKDKTKGDQYKMSRTNIDQYGRSQSARGSNEHYGRSRHSSRETNTSNLNNGNRSRSRGSHRDGGSKSRDNHRSDSKESHTSGSVESHRSGGGESHRSHRSGGGESHMSVRNTSSISESWSHRNTSRESHISAEEENPASHRSGRESHRSVRSISYRSESWDSHRGHRSKSGESLTTAESTRSSRQDKNINHSSRKRDNSQIEKEKPGELVPAQSPMTPSTDEGSILSVSDSDNNVEIQISVKVLDGKMSSNRKLMGTVTEERKSVSQSVHSIHLKRGRVVSDGKLVAKNYRESKLSSVLERGKASASKLGITTNNNAIPTTKTPSGRKDKALHRGRVKVSTGSKVSGTTGTTGATETTVNTEASTVTQNTENTAGAGAEASAEKAPSAGTEASADKAPDAGTEENGHWTWTEATEENPEGAWTWTETSAETEATAEKGYWTWTKATEENPEGTWTWTETEEAGGNGYWTWTEANEENPEGAWTWTETSAETEATTENAATAGKEAGAENAAGAGTEAPAENAISRALAQNAITKKNGIIAVDEKAGVTYVRMDREVKDQAGNVTIVNDVFAVQHAKSETTAAVIKDGAAGTTTELGKGAAIPTELSKGSPAVPTELSKGSPAVPTELSKGSPAVPTELNKGNPAVPSEFSKGSPAVPTELNKGNPAVPTELNKGSPAVPTELNKGNPAVPTELNKGSPVVPTELNKGNPAVPAELNKNNPAVPTELSKGSPAVPTELNKGNPAVPTELNKGSPAVPATVTAETTKGGKPATVEDRISRALAENSITKKDGIIAVDEKAGVTYVREDIAVWDKAGNRTIVNDVIAVQHGKNETSGRNQAMAGNKAGEMPKLLGEGTNTTLASTTGGTSLATEKSTTSLASATGTSVIAERNRAYLTSDKSGTALTAKRSKDGNLKKDGTAVTKGGAVVTFESSKGGAAATALIAKPIRLGTAPNTEPTWIETALTAELSQIKMPPASELTGSAPTAKPSKGSTALTAQPSGSSRAGKSRRDGSAPTSKPTKSVIALTPKLSKSRSSTLAGTRTLPSSGASGATWVTATTGTSNASAGTTATHISGSKSGTTSAGTSGKSSTSARSRPTRLTHTKSHGHVSRTNVDKLADVGRVTHSHQRHVEKVKPKHPGSEKQSVAAPKARNDNSTLTPPTPPETETAQTEENVEEVANPQEEEPSVRMPSSYLMKKVGSKASFSTTNTETSLRKSHTEEVLSHSVSETVVQMPLEDEDDPKSLSPVGLSDIKAAIRKAAHVPVDLEEAEPGDYGFTPADRRVFIAKRIRQHRRFLMDFLRRIFWEESLLDEDGALDKDIYHGIKFIFSDLEDDIFSRDVIDMMVDIARHVMKDHPGFTCYLLETSVREIFKHMNISGSAWYESGRGFLNRKMLILLMNAYNKCVADGGLDHVVRVMYKSYPVVVLRLVKEYGRKYKDIIYRLVEEGKFSTQTPQKNTASGLESESETGTNIIEGGMSKEEMGQF